MRNEEEDFNIYTEELRELKEDYVTMRKRYETEAIKLKLEKDKLEKSIKGYIDREKIFKEKEGKCSLLEKRIGDSTRENNFMVVKLQDEIKTYDSTNSGLIEENNVLKNKLKGHESENDTLTKTNIGI